MPKRKFKMIEVPPDAYDLKLRAQEGYHLAEQQEEKVFQRIECAAKPIEFDRLTELKIRRDALRSLGR